MESINVSAQAPVGHSATVQLLLHVGARAYELADVGPNDTFLKKPATFLAGDAVLEIITDGRSHRTSVSVLESTDTVRVRFSKT